MVIVPAAIYFLLSTLSPLLFSYSADHLMAFAFEKLIVYQKSVDFADQICSRTESFPRGYGFLCDQMNRAALSIAANTIAEGNGALRNLTAATSSALCEAQCKNAYRSSNWRFVVVF